MAGAEPAHPLAVVVAPARDGELQLSSGKVEVM